MKHRYTWIITLLAVVLLMGSGALSAQGISNFSLKNHKGEMVSLSQFSEKTATVVIFTGNHCVYSKKYEDRLVEMGLAYQEQGIQFLLINSNDPVTNQEETLEVNAAKAAEKQFPFPYLQDADHSVAEAFGAVKQPEVFVVVPGEGESWTLVYSGKIDDNPLMAAKVKTNYLKDALAKVLAGDLTPSESTEPSGCNIRF